MRKKTRSIVWKVLLAVVAISVVGIGTALVQEDKSGDGLDLPDVKYVWTAPAGSAPVHHYVVQVLVNDTEPLNLGPVYSEEIMVPVEHGNKYQVRVAAVDASGIQGAWSIWSEFYNPELGDPAPLD